MILSSFYGDLLSFSSFSFKQLPYTYILSQHPTTFSPRGVKRGTKTCGQTERSGSEGLATRLSKLRGEFTLLWEMYLFPFGSLTQFPRWKGIAGAILYDDHYLGGLLAWCLEGWKWLNHGDFAKSWFLIWTTPTWLPALWTDCTMVENRKNTDKIAI